MAKLVDARDSKSRGSNTVSVRVRPPAPLRVGMSTDCIFCSISVGAITAQIIAHTDDVIVIKDISPKSEYHYLIIPRTHYPDLQAADETTISKLLRTAQTLACENSHLADYRLVINNGFQAGQRVFHLHIHFLAGKSLPEF